MKDFFQEVNPGFQSYLKLAATLTLVVENFYSQMRSRNYMPTVLEFACLFVPTIRESPKQLTDTQALCTTPRHTRTMKHPRVRRSLSETFHQYLTQPPWRWVKRIKRCRWGTGETTLENQFASWPFVTKVKKTMWGRFHCTHTRHRILFQGLWIFPPQTKSTTTTTTLALYLHDHKTLQYCKSIR